jgi:hypothetical protein
MPLTNNQISRASPSTQKLCINTAILKSSFNSRSSGHLGNRSNGALENLKMPATARFNLLSQVPLRVGTLGHILPVNDKPNACLAGDL